MPVLAVSKVCVNAAVSVPASVPAVIEGTAAEAVVAS